MLGVGDDCALLAPSPGHELAVSVDTSVAQVHFPGEAPAFAIGHRALAVSLSDLAAMGAKARWCVMSLTLSNADDAWLGEYARGFHALCLASGVSLVGGDVTRGELAIGVTVHGEVPTGSALRRSGASVGEWLAVTGTLGGAHAGLLAWQAGERDLADNPWLGAYLLPQPRLAAGQALRGLASAAIDISDGLVADLDHLCRASGVGAQLDCECLPLPEGLQARLGEQGALRAALCGGDDYELLISLAQRDIAEARARLAGLGLSLTLIGRVTRKTGVQGVPDEARSGWQHFSGETP